MYRAHNAGIAGGYLERRALAEAASAAERFFMNVVLAHVLVLLEWERTEYGSARMGS